MMKKSHWVIQSEKSCDSRLANSVLCCCRVLRWRDAEPWGGAKTEEGGGERRRCSFSQDPSLPPAWGEEETQLTSWCHSGWSGNDDYVISYLCRRSPMVTSSSPHCDGAADRCCHGNPSSSSSFAASEPRPSQLPSDLWRRDTGHLTQVRRWQIIWTQFSTYIKICAIHVFYFR